jgi:hypothetical protein
MKNIIVIIYFTLFIFSIINAQSLTINPVIGSTLFLSTYVDFGANDKIFITPRPNTGLMFEFFYKNIGIHSGLILAKGASVFALPNVFAVSHVFPKIYLNYRGWQVPILLTSKIIAKKKKFIFRPYVGISVILPSNYQDASGILERELITQGNSHKIEIGYEIFGLRRFYPTFAGDLGIGIDYNLTKKMALTGSVFSLIGYKSVISHKAFYSIRNVGSPAAIRGEATLNAKSDQYILQLGLAYKLF